MGRDPKIQAATLPSLLVVFASSHVLEFLKPDGWKLLIFSVLAFICVGGLIQSYAFVDDFIPPPPFYEELRPLDLWAPSMLLILPFLPFYSILSELLVHIPLPSGTFFKPPLGCLLLSYVEGAWFVIQWREMSWRGRRISSILALLPSVFYISAPDPVFALSGAVLSFLVILVHLVAFYGLAKAVHGWASRPTTREIESPQ